MIYTHIAVAAVAALAAWFFQGNRYEVQIAEIQAAHAQADRLATEEAARIYGELTARYEGALNDARKRETALRRDTDAARTESDGMRSQLSDAARLIAAAPPAAVADYAATVGELLADCGRRHQELAAKADGHASDVRTLVQAWPGVNP